MTDLLSRADELEKRIERIAIEWLHGEHINRINKTIEGFDYEAFAQEVMGEVEKYQSKLIQELTTKVREQEENIKVRNEVIARLRNATTALRGRLEMDFTASEGGFYELQIDNDGIAFRDSKIKTLTAKVREQEVALKDIAKNSDATAYPEDLIKWDAKNYCEMVAKQVLKPIQEETQ